MKKSIIVFIFISIFLITLNATGTDNKPAGYTGSTACQPCHKEIYETWKSSKHAAAFKPEQKNSQACLVCHATVTGASDQAEAENNIGCEACHGPGSHHVAWAEHDTFELYFGEAFENLLAYAHGTPRSVVNPEVLNR